jgi:hypothetical protein
LFYLKVVNKFDLTIEKLKEIIRYDWDKYDLSTLLVIELLYYFEKTKKFKTNNGLILNVLYKHIENNIKEKLNLSSYFEECQGRMYIDKHSLKLYRTYKSGSEFCDCSQQLKSINYYTGKKSWWCNGGACLERCETIHSKEQWEEYTLLDFCEIFSFNTDGRKKNGEINSKGLYYNFISLINHCNFLFKHLFCRDCNHVIYPSESANLASRNVTKFHCINEKCENNTEIYLNRCFGCGNSIIDSRDSKQCPSGWYICEHCGTCCSKQKMDQRYKNKLEFNQEEDVKLKKKIDNKEFHLDRNICYCHKYECSKECTKITEDKYTITFSCPECKKEYKRNKPYSHKDTP